jgi:hypothetical protein
LPFSFAWHRGTVLPDGTFGMVPIIILPCVCAATRYVKRMSVGGYSGRPLRRGGRTSAIGGVGTSAMQKNAA